jgi:hypothetical protein
MFGALISMACSTTVREREVVYVPVGVQMHRACPCPPPGRVHSANGSEAYEGRDAVPRIRHSPGRAAHHAKKEKDGVKWGRKRAKSKRHHPPGREIAKAERADGPPGFAKGRKRER